MWDVVNHPGQAIGMAAELKQEVDVATLSVPVSDHDHIQGPHDAAVTLVEYADYQCPYCGQAYGVVKQLQQRFGDQMRVVFRNFPLQDMHPEAVPAALVAEFAGSHDKFWPVHDALYENQDQLGSALYERIITDVGLDPNAMRHAVAGESLLQRLQSDLDGGISSGVQGTPAFFINGEFFPGGYPDLGAAISKVLPNS